MCSSGLVPPGRFSLLEHVTLVRIGARTVIAALRVLLLVTQVSQHGCEHGHIFLVDVCEKPFTLLLLGIGAFALRVA